MSIFGWKADAVMALKYLNDELRRMHVLLYSHNVDFDMTKTEIMDRIVKLQETFNEGIRKLCGLEY